MQLSSLTCARALGLIDGSVAARDGISSQIYFFGGVKELKKYYFIRTLQQNHFCR
jgi:hypothetical protein